jgi:N-acetylmuramoyl-L-alanine amidase/putative methionine-R-sulfoxide reductase with GAF domain
MATNPSNADTTLTLQSPSALDAATQDALVPSSERRDALQALLAFSTLHEQIRRRRAEEARRHAAGAGAGDRDWEFEQFVLDEVLQLVAERAQAITGASGIAIALAEGDEIICRASVGSMAPDRGMRLDAKAGFSGTCFRSGRIVRCDDSEKDPRVNLEACRRLETRSMVAVPLQGQQSVVGLLEAFSNVPFAFNDSDVRGLNLLAELILAALKPEDEDRIVRAAKVAAAELQSAELESLRLPMTPPPPLAPAFGDAPDSVALEFSKDDIAPDLYQEEPGSNRFARVIAIVAILGLLLSGGLWWKFRRASRATIPTIGGGVTSPVIPQASSLNTSSENPATSASAPPVPTVPPATRGTGSAPSLVGNIHHSNADGVSTVTIDLQAPVQYRKNRLPNPERIYFDLLNTSLAPGKNGEVIEVKDGLIGRIRVAQPASNVTRIVLETKAGSTFWDNLQMNPHRLVIEVRSAEALKTAPKTAIDITSPPGKPAAQQPSIVPLTPPAALDRQSHAQAAKLRIVIDAGHGGWDLGTVGREGLLEKNLVLSVAQALGNLLETQLGSEVIFTRKDDNYVSLEERAEIANRAQADLFISVHANYSSLATARGVETYYSSFFSPPEAREIEYRENATATTVTGAKLSGRALKEKVDESKKLAASVQRALYGKLAAQGRGIRDRGVREASFVVLTGTEMPSILAEISFVSSPADEERLRSPEYRQQIAEALYKGIERFATASHRVKVASASALTSSGQ